MAFTKSVRFVCNCHLGSGSPFLDIFKDYFIVKVWGILEFLDKKAFKPSVVIGMYRKILIESFMAISFKLFKFENDESPKDTEIATFNAAIFVDNQLTKLVVRARFLN